MATLGEAVLAAIEKYDEVLEETSATPNAADADNAEAAAHECVAEIRAALEARPGPSIANLNNPIARLQERAQRKGNPMPDYRFTQSGLPHVPSMVCVCTCEGIEGTGRGASKQKAKRLAAKAVLETMYGSPAR